MDWRRNEVEAKKKIRVETHPLDDALSGED